MKRYLLAVISSFLFISITQAQLAPNYKVVVKRNDNDTMSLPWVGGLNNPQFSNVDLNNDGIKDLFIFDRTGNKVLTFLGHGTAGKVDFTYNPEYEKGFPALVDWALLVDYNCDGIADIFSYSEGTTSGVGFRVFRGFYDLDNHIQFEVADSILTFLVDNLPVNLYVSSVDIPAVVDVNGDGDVDILTFQQTGGYVEYFENLSKESGFGCDSLIYKKEDDCWGDFFEPALQRADLLNQPCPFFGAAQGESDVRLHSGSAELAWDNTGDGLLEMLKGDISWDNLDYLTNDGTPSDAHMFEEDTLFPSYDVSAHVFIFPAPFLADVNNDGLRDLLVAPNAAGGSQNFYCSWYYKNVGDAVKGIFNYQSDTFLVGDMIDVGELSYPAFFDVDLDGLKDLIVGNRGYFDQSNTNLYSGQLSYYKNIGDAENPAFKLITKDFANLKSLNVKTVPPTFGDLDGDGDADMLVGQEDGSLLFFKNTAAPGAPANFVFFNANYAGIDVGSFSTPQLVDVNRDGLLDLLIGEQNGNLDYYQNSGSASSPAFPSLPTNSFFGGVDVRQPSYVTGYSVPYLFDNGDGLGYQLLVGSQRGTVYKYSNIDNNLGSTFTKDDSTFDDINMGGYATVSGGDINSDGKADLLVGNFRGGVTFYDSKLTGINEQTLALESSVHLYPNPSSSQVEITLGKEFSNQSKARVVDVMGREVTEINFLSKNFSLDVSEWKAGIYFLLINNDNYRIVKKLVVNHS